MVVLALDPGMKKFGFAVVSSDKGILKSGVAKTAEFVSICREILKDFAADAVIVGGGTGSADIADRLRRELQIEPKIVDESHTTERAKFRYFKDYPPKGFWRLVPLGLRTPPRPYDDYAAVVMAEDFFKTKGC